jgi:hypothetical protein
MQPNERERRAMWHDEMPGDIATVPLPGTISNLWEMDKQARIVVQGLAHVSRLNS